MKKRIVKNQRANPLIFLSDPSVSLSYSLTNVEERKRVKANSVEPVEASQLEKAVDDRQLVKGFLRSWVSIKKSMLGSVVPLTLLMFRIIDQHWSYNKWIMIIIINIGLIIIEEVCNLDLQKFLQQQIYISQRKVDFQQIWSENHGCGNLCLPLRNTFS